MGETESSTALPGVARQERKKWKGFAQRSAFTFPLSTRGTQHHHDRVRWPTSWASGRSRSGAREGGGRTASVPRRRQGRGGTGAAHLMSPERCSGARLEGCFSQDGRRALRAEGAGGLMNRPVNTHGRRPAINALVTAGDAPAISGRSCFSCHFGPGPRM
jgi:hypothetical protein